MKRNYAYISQSQNDSQLTTYGSPGPRSRTAVLLRRPTRMRVKRSANLVPTVKNLVKSEIRKIEEVKSVQYLKQNQLCVSANNTANWTSTFFPISLSDATGVSVNQGAGAAGRIGNRIRTRKVMFRGIFVPLPYQASFNLTPQPYEVTMWIVTDKTNPTLVPDGTNLLQLGNTSIGPQGIMLDSISPVNTDKYQLHARHVFKLGTAVSDGTGNQAGYQSFANNDFSYNCKFDLDVTRFMPTNVLFNDATTLPTTKGVFVLISVGAAVGTALSATAQPVGLTYTIDYQYTDV